MGTAPDRYTRLVWTRVLGAGALCAVVALAGCSNSPESGSSFESGVSSESAASAGPSAPPSGPVITRPLYDTVFPDRDAFYSYDGLMAATGAYPDFANTGDDTTRRREAAAFLANIFHEADGLKAVVEADTSNYGNYCDPDQPYGCPAGTDAYFGRGPVMLSWNYNYRNAGVALGVDLLTDPALVQQDPAIAWKTALWFWNTQTGGTAVTPHHAMVDGLGFGGTIRAFNGNLECDGHNPEEVQNRVDDYRRIAALLNVSPGDNLSC